MAITGSRTFVGFGLGPIQAGLFLYEALQSGGFGRLVVAEVVADIVAAVRRAGGMLTVNIAFADHVEQASVGPLEVFDPGQEDDRRQLIAAIAAAEELATAVPSVAYYATASAGSIHRLLAAGLKQKAAGGGPRAVVYAAENHNRAAEILAGHVLAEMAEDERQAVQQQVRFLNTVIGKMSGVISDPHEIKSLGLAPVTPGGQRAFLVESFNRILISAIEFADGLPFERGIGVFEERTDLLPFEEAKLYGHNATHALMAYLAALAGVERIADVSRLAGVLPFVRAAFVEESGGALVRKHGGLDPLFTTSGYRAYADDLLARMLNPYLGDTVERVGRDPARKLGWDDRLIGTLRLALGQGIVPRRYAMGAAAAAAMLDRDVVLGTMPMANLLRPLWRASAPSEHDEQQVLALVEAGRAVLRAWCAAGFPDLEAFYRRRQASVSSAGA